MKIKTEIFACSFIALLALTACDKSDNNEFMNKIEVEDIDRRQGVDVETVALTNISSKQNFTGYVSPKKAVTVCPKVEGVVSKLMVKQGDAVKADSPLYELDTQPYLNNIKENKARIKELKASLNSATTTDKQASSKLEKYKLTLKKAQKQAKRYKVLVNEGAVSEQAYQQAMDEVNSVQVLIENSKVESLKALSDIDAINARIQTIEEQINLDNQALKDTKIMAPMSGTVIYNPLQKGQAITSRVNTCISIAQLDPIVIDIPVTTDEFLALKENQQSHKKQGKKTQKPAVQLILNDDKIYAESIKFIFDETRITQDNRIVLRVLFANKNNLLFPNMKVKAQVDIPNNETDGVALLPLEAIHYLTVPVKEVLKPLPTEETEAKDSKDDKEKQAKKADKPAEKEVKSIADIEQIKVTENNKPFVYVVDKKTSTLKRKFINIKNIANTNQVVVNKGLETGDKVVLSSEGDLEEGVEVKINAVKNYTKKERKPQPEDKKQS